MARQARAAQIQIDPAWQLDNRSSLNSFYSLVASYFLRSFLSSRVIILMDDDYLLDLTQRVLPWVSTQVLIIGSQTLDNTYGKLGCDLFILAQKIPSIIEDRTVRTTLVKVLRLLNKACSVSQF